jgi:tRNA (cytidine/uridine-2'-O-)-methyltransferase
MKNDAFIFGPESRGLPKKIRESFNSIYIPMKSEGRSLNLANAVSIIVYEAWSRFNFD